MSASGKGAGGRRGPRPTVLAIVALLSAPAGAAAQEIAGPATGEPDAPVAAAGIPAPVFEAVYRDPADIEANLAYAAAAEEADEFRKALTTYERVLLIDPDNATARDGLARMRFLLAPNFTNFRLTAGGGYESNPLQQAEILETPGSALAIFLLRARDERRIGARRWRTNAFAGAELFAETDEVNQVFLGADFGPIFPVAGTFSVRPAVIGGYRSLDGVTLYGEIGGALDVEGYLEGALQSARLSVVYRQYDDRWVSDDGVVADLSARFARAGVISPDDTVVFRPNARYSGIENEGDLLIPTNLAPGQFFQLGGQLQYFYGLTERLALGAEFAVYQRWFDDPPEPGEEDRRDTFISPGAKLIVGDVFRENIDFTVDYNFQHNASNDPERDFNNHRVIGRIGIDF